MLNLLKRFLKREEKNSRHAEGPTLLMTDVNGESLVDGDYVVSLRYDLGKCQLVKIAGVWHYKSQENGQQVNWSRMIDATTGFQKVKKIT